MSLEFSGVLVASKKRCLRECIRPGHNRPATGTKDLHLAVCGMLVLILQLVAYHLQQVATKPNFCWVPVRFLTTDIFSKLQWLSELENDGHTVFVKIHVTRSVSQAGLPADSTCFPDMRGS